MQAQLNFTFDLGTAAGRAELHRLFQHLLLPTATGLTQPTVQVEPKLEQSQAGYSVQAPPSEPPAPRRFGDGGTSIPDDPARAAAALAGRQAAAAKARAAKAAKAEAAAGNGQVDDSADLTGPELNGQDQDQAVEEDLGLVVPNMSPAEAKEAGLAIVREAYAAGKVAQVKALQRAWGIAKFYDIPNERGHEFFAQVMKLAHEIGLRK